MRFLLLLVASLIFSQNAMALSDYYRVYPPVMQTLINSTYFEGDRHGDYRGDDVAVLSDGSAWKIHPESSGHFRSWQNGDVIHVAVRNDWYWFKREHKFLLINHTRNDEVKAMICQHKFDPPLQIVRLDTYHKSTCTEIIPKIKPTFGPGGATVSTSYTFQEAPCEFRKVVVLSDGSTWVVRDHLSEFQLGMNVYIGAQGLPGRFYDFVLITGDEREAIWTLARPSK